MRRSEQTVESSGSHHSQRPAFDWRGWVIFAWVVWFGLLYGKMVVEQRGGKVRAALGAGNRAAEPSTERGAR